nr:MAG TPA: hypothetical protein [Caudoviricetes sp.]DAU29835.1 MAG TPA: hypothetical protein [Caudoviricetes sp.]
MTTEKLYDTIKGWRDSCDTAGLYLVAKDMDTTLKQLEFDLLLQQSKKSGTKSIVTAANRIIKNAESTGKDVLVGMFENKDKYGEIKYCVCDGFVAIRFNEKPLLPEIDEKYYGQEMQLEQIVKPMDGSKEITLPDISELKVYIKTHKIKEKNNSKKVADYLLNEGLNLWVNPQYLLNVMECLPDCKAYAANRISPIYLKAENGDGVVMPVNHK